MRRDELGRAGVAGARRGRDKPGPVAAARPSAGVKADMARECWQRMRELAHDPRLLSELQDLAAEAGIVPGAVKALDLLSRSTGARMSELAARLRCDNSYVTTIVDSLEDAGLARREPHPTDRRVKVIVLTDAGRRLAERAHRALATPPPAFALLSASQTAALRDLLRTLGEGSGPTG